MTTIPQPNSQPPTLPKSILKPGYTRPFARAQNQLKPAYQSPNVAKGNSPIRGSEFVYDLETMFTEKGPSGNCYKSFAKWDLCNRDDYFQEIVNRHDFEDEYHDSAYNKAKRCFLWSILAENIFSEDAISFYSAQMRRRYGDPIMMA